MKVKQAVSRYILKKHGAVAFKRYRTTEKNLAGPSKNDRKLRDLAKVVAAARARKMELLRIDDPKVTVALPLWEARRIAWIALEGLARQEGAPPWELIVEEETSYALGARALEGYIPRLVEAGCCRVVYVSLNKRIPLAAKWRNIAQEAEKVTRAFVFQSADCYSPPTRIAETFELLRQQEWVQQKTGYFFDLTTEALALYDATGAGYPTALNMATRTKYVKSLPICALGSSVDAWLYQIVTRVIGRAPRVGWLQGTEGIDTNGANKITKDRLRLMRDFAPPFRQPKGEPNLPEEIWHRLRNFM